MASAGPPLSVPAPPAGLAGPPLAPGKGKAPPPPAPKGKGKGGGKALGPPPKAPAGAPTPPPAAKKGAGKGPPAKGPLAAKGQGRGKGAGPSEQKVPPHLSAPPGAALLHVHSALPSAAGTVWEGLHPWGAARAPPLEGFAIDYDRLREQWAPPPALPPMPKAPGERLDRRASLDVNVAIGACRLTPELVRRGMHEDMDALSAEQTEVLAVQVVPHVAEAAGVLAAAVARGGVAALSRAEALLWAVAEVPGGAARLQLLGVRRKLEGEIACAAQHAEETDALVQRLRSSQPLRVLLQAVLAIRNVLAQRGCEGFQLQDLSRLACERARAGARRGSSPTVLALTAETLEATHSRRCRLRFLRMMAVGRLLPKDSLRRQVWAYVDDLGPTPWEVLPLLAACRGSLVDESASMVFAQRGRDARLLLANHIPQVEDAIARGGAAAASQRWSCQLGELRARVVDAGHVFQEGRERVVAAAAALRGLFAVRATARDAAGALTDAADVLNALRGLGHELGRERAALDVRQRARELRARGDLGGRCARSWSPVDTTMIQRLATSDPDLFRALLASPLEAGPPAQTQTQAKAKAKAKAKARAKAGAGPVPYIDLAHGGIEGDYARCPLTGRWVRSRRAPGAVDPVVCAGWVVV